MHALVSPDCRLLDVALDFQPLLVVPDEAAHGAYRRVVAGRLTAGYHKRRPARALMV